MQDWDENEILKLKQYFEIERKSVKEVAEMYKIAPSILREILSKNGINYKNGILTKWKDSEIDIVREELSKGTSFTKISRILSEKSPSQIHTLYRDYHDFLNLVIGKRTLKHQDKIERIRELVNDGYTRFEIGEILGIHPSVVLTIKRRNNIKTPRMKELHERGIFHLTIDRKEVRVDLGLTKEKLTSLLNQGKTHAEIAKLYGLDNRLISTLAKDIGMEDKKVARSKEIKKKILFQITGKEAIPSDLNKAFVDIFTKDFLEDLLKKNGYCLEKCAADLGGIDSKCISKAIEKYNIIIPEDIKEDIFNYKTTKNTTSKFVSNSMGEYFTEKALQNLGLTYKRQLRKYDVVPKDIRQHINIDYYLSYNNQLIYIEYNGSQHYHFSKQFHKRKEIFISQAKRDHYLREYCRKNNILFLEIPYLFYTVNEIEDLLKRTIIDGEDISSIVDYDSLFSEIKELNLEL